MDENRVRKAIEALKEYRKLAKCMNDMERLPYYDLAIEALEKQLPKKPIDKSCVKDNDTIVGYVGRCPGCNGIVDDSMIVCDCAQVLDGSE